ncbi:MAG TPA: hypothetical protein VJV79_00170 [Polyangiaceae bacterium]|nr:hypothetical protein [Polyangiaceae bacterium]
MNDDDYFADLLPVADAVLYEGYVLFPYRASSSKNRVRWTFGGVYPRSYSRAQTGSDRSEVGCECLAIGADSELCVEVRFLELLERVAAEPLETARPCSHRHAFGKLAALVGHTLEYAFSGERLHGSLELRVEALAPNQFKLALRLQNESNSPAIERERALPDTLIAAHLLLGLQGGQFVSQLDPAPAHRAASAACVQRGLWPVLAGKKGSLDRILASPIILYDYPEIAPESRADSCDATEIDEILLLRVLTLSDAEKAELRRGEPRARSILERAEALSGDEQLRLHGRLRKPAATGSPAIGVGERVRLRPKARADIFDLALSGRSATVRAVERDFENRVHLSVTVDDDPGADLGIAGFPGHRFFFFLDEVERLSEGAP